MPKELDEKVAELHFQVLSTEFFLSVVHKLVDFAGCPHFAGSRVDPAQKIHAESLIKWLMRRSAASAELTRQVEKSTPSAYERVISVVVDQGTEKWLLTS